MQTDAVMVGIDVAKAEVVVAVNGQAARSCTVRNDAASLQGWLEGLPAGALLALESTGRHHTLLAHLAHARGLKVYVLNARDIYFYARALGTRGKTDRVDAGVIACYLAEHHGRLHAWQPASAVQGELDELLRRRAQVVKYQVALRQSFEGLPGLREAQRALHGQFESFLSAIDARMREVLHTDAKLALDARRLNTVTGIGVQGSTMLTVLFNRLDFANADALVAYAGLDPRPCDSGSKRGRRRLTKRGPATLRRQVWLMGFSASHSKAFKPLYAALRERGLASTEAMLILGRKLLRVAFAIWKHGDSFDPARLQPHHA